MREFLEKTKVKKLLDEGWAKGIYPRNDIMQLFSFTEQGIVRPYFERLKQEINAYKEVHDNYCKNIENGDFWANHTSDHYKSSGGKATACEAILGMIDKILSEQEKEE